jgi:trehalose/maltose transport system substrate-binding protein
MRLLKLDRVVMTSWAALLMAGCAAPPVGTTLTISCGTSAADREFCGKPAEEWGRKNGYTVKMYSPPSSTFDQLLLLLQKFDNKSPEIDVIMTDVVWPAVLKDHLVDLTPYSKGVQGEHFPAIVANNTIDGKLLGMPWFTDAGLLFYRKDLLEKYGAKAPSTWDELAAAAKKLQDGERASGSADFQGFVFQAKAYEGLTCNALEWVHGFGGGTIVDDAGNITINNAAAARALNMAASWIGTIAPDGVLNYGEEDARGVWQNGKAAFLRNWPYTWSLGQATGSPIRGKIGVSVLPAGSGPGARHAATLGGWQLAVSKYSKHVDAAASLVMYLTSRDIQKARALAGSYNPTIPALYKDKDVTAANPFMAELLDVLTNGVARPASPTGLKYPEVSNAFWEATREVLEKKATGEQAVEKLEARLRQIRQVRW